jgi:two-component system cell cycle response regulator
VDLQTGSFGVWMMAIPVLSISYILRLYYELRHASYQLKSLNDVSMSFTSELDLEKTMQSILLGLRQMVSYDRAILYLKDWNSDMLYPYLTDPSSCDPEENVQAQIPMGIGIVGEAALLQKSRLIHRKNMIISLDREPEMVAENASMLVVPIVFEEQVYGVILLGSQSEYHFHERDLNLVRIMATQAAVAIKNALRFRKTERRSQVDELTGLYNFRFFDKMLNRMVEEAASKQEPLSLLVIDIDYFKKINDTFGHLVGNEALVAVAGTIKANVRKKDIVARYGGEEFTVLLPNTTSEEAMEIAERIRKQVGRTRFKAGSSINGNENVYLTFTVSIGIATYPDQADSAQSLVRHADRAMYVGSKQQGRNRVAVYGA